MFGLAALVMVAALALLPARVQIARASSSPSDPIESELVDGEGFGLPDPELVA